MLTNLYVKNLALIDETNIDFEEGLTVLTGETGAGKSILLGAINIALGEKVPADMVREDGKEAVAQLGFYFDEKFTSFLKDRDVPVEDDGVLIIRRGISSGRSRFKINGCDVTASQVKEIAPYLLDLHAQRDNLRLLKEREQLFLVDSFAGKEAEELVLDISEKLSAANALKHKLNDLGSDSEARERELDLLRFEADEIEAASLKEGEDEDLEAKYTKGENAGRIKEAALAAVNAILGDNVCVSSCLSEAIKNISDISELVSDKELLDIKDMLYDADSILSDCARELDSYAESVDADEEEFASVTQRLNIYNKLKDKYRTDTKGLMILLEEKQRRISELENSDVLLNEYRNKISELESEMNDLCEKLTSLRKKAAKVITEKLISAAKDLNFNDIRFDIEVSKTPDFTSVGNNRVSFLISTNPGEDLKPLKDVASGGELSRIMLAFKTVTADCDGTETLIFDEIDTGISGRTAQMVAEKMANVAEDRQIICITHLPQIAAMGDHHLLITKAVEDERSVTDMTVLDNANRIIELSRLLGGGKITDAVKKNAKEMITLADMYKKSGKL